MQEEKLIFIETTIKASLEETWQAWTTEEGVRSFLAPACKIDLHPDGEYEIYFNPDAPAGERGGEGNQVMVVQPIQMFSFSWNAPPSLPEVRDQRTHVVLRFYQEQEDTRVTMRHDGWGTGGQWDEAYKYFERAWGEVVFPRLKYRFERRPVDWEDPPSMEELAAYSP